MQGNQPKTTSRSKSKKSTTRKPATSKGSAKATRASKAAAGTKKRTTAKRSAGNGTEVLSAHQRANRIAVAAYYLAEQRGFAPDHELDDWLAAERSL